MPPGGNLRRVFSRLTSEDEIEWVRAYLLHEPGVDRGAAAQSGQSLAEQLRRERERIYFDFLRQLERDAYRHYRAILDSQGSVPVALKFLARCRWHLAALSFAGTAHFWGVGSERAWVLRHQDGLQEVMHPRVIIPFPGPQRAA